MKYIQSSCSCNDLKLELYPNMTFKLHFLKLRPTYPGPLNMSPSPRISIPRSTCFNALKKNIFLRIILPPCREWLRMHHKSIENQSPISFSIFKISIF